MAHPIHAAVPSSRAVVFLCLLFAYQTKVKCVSEIFVNHVSCDMIRHACQSWDQCMKQDDDLTSKVDAIYRRDSRRVFATLVRVVGDFDLAEEAMHEAFAAAVSQWGNDGMPSNPLSWLITTGRHKAIDVIRRRERFDASLHDLLAKHKDNQSAIDDAMSEIPDDRLRLIFTCCHPAIAIDAQLALTLREVCGLTTEQVASAFLISPATLAQRIVRAKAKIKTAKIPYEIPSLEQMPQRLESVLNVIYLLFNEGYSASSGEQVLQTELSSEAIRLCRLLLALQEDSPHVEVMGLLALMLLHESRRAARTDDHGDLILLEDQDRSLWDQQMIIEGCALVDDAFATGQIGAYTLQAAISAVHARATEASQTDWHRMVTLYDLLLQLNDSPVVSLNRAVAIAMRDGAAAGLAALDEIAAEGSLAEYHLYHAAYADLCRRLGHHQQARQSYERALTWAQQQPERRYLQKRLSELI